MIVYKDKISTIEYDNEHQNITYLEHGLSNKDLLMGQFKSVLEFSKKETVSSVIVDLRELHGSFKNVFHYLNNTYYPTLKSRGLICKAFIVTDDLINNHLVGILCSNLKNMGIESAVFSNPRAARKWTQMCKTAALQGNKTTKLSA